MIETVNRRDFDQTVIIQTDGATISSGQTLESWANTYTGVKCKKLPPLKYEAEKMSLQQGVYTERLSWLMALEDRSIVPNGMRVVHDSKNHNITNVRPYKGSRNYIVLDTEYKDNQ